MKILLGKTTVTGKNYSSRVTKYCYFVTLHACIYVIAMVAPNAASLTVCNCTFILATVSRNYSDIGTIKIDAYINTRRSHPGAITAIHGVELTASIWFERHRTNPIHGVIFIAVTSSPRYLPKLVFKNQFPLDGCSD